MPLTLKPKLDPEHWRRCVECGAVLLRAVLDNGEWNQEVLIPHRGHHLVPASGIHFWEYVRICLGWL